MDLKCWRLSGSPRRWDDLSEWVGRRKTQTNDSGASPSQNSIPRSGIHVVLLVFRTPAWESCFLTTLVIALSEEGWGVFGHLSHAVGSLDNGSGISCTHPQPPAPEFCPRLIWLWPPPPIHPSTQVFTGAWLCLLLWQVALRGPSGSLLIHS